MGFSRQGYCSGLPFSSPGDLTILQGKNSYLILFLALVGRFFTTKHYLSSVQLLSCVQLFTTPWTAACRASLSITNSWSLIKLMSIKSVMPSNNLILCYLLLLPSSIFPRIKIFSNESALHIRCVDHNKLWKILKEMGIPDRLTCLLRNLYTGQEATVRLDMEQQTGSK